MNRRAFLTALGAVVAKQKWSRLNFSRESLAIDPPEDQAPVTTVRYPYLQNVRSDRASILWATLQPGIGLGRKEIVPAARSRLRKLAK